MGKILKIVFCLAVLAPIVLSGCNSSGCTELRSAVPRADFYESGSTKQISIDSLQITGVGAPGDSMLYDGTKRLSSAYLPMPPLRDKVEWKLTYLQKALYDYGITDMIAMEYERMPWFAGEECGAMFKYRIYKLDYSRNVIDSVVLVDSLVTNIDQATLNVYFRVSEN